MIMEEAMQVFDGLMLGDCGLRLHGDFAVLHLSLSAGDPTQWWDTPWSGRTSRIPQIQYLVHIMDCLERLGLEFCKGHPRAFVSYNQSGKPYLYCDLTSLVSPFLLTQFKRWYHPITDEVRKTRWFAVNRKWYKILPDDIRLTPSIVAKWFEGDGSTEWISLTQVLLRFATESFTREEVEKLVGLFLLLGIRARSSRKPTKRQIAWVLAINAIDSVNAFFDLTEELIHPCYQYKIKRPKHALDYKTEEEIRSNVEQNKCQQGVISRLREELLRS